MRERYIMVVDIDRCIGCKGCEVACKLEHGSVLGSSRISVKTEGPTGTYPDLQMYFLPIMCQQCEVPTCNESCPYDAIHFNNESRRMEKCDLCRHLRKLGEKPACVKNCPGRALIVGDINDPDSEVSKALRSAGEENISALNDSDNHPTVRYILRKTKLILQSPNNLANH